MTSPLRVLMVCPQFRPLVGGYERAAERLAHGLIAAGHEVHVVTERRERSWPRREVDGSLLIRRLWCWPRRGLHVVSSVLSLGSFLLARVRRYDVIHVHQYGWLAAVAIAVGRFHGRPVVLKLTNTGYWGIAATLERGGLVSVSEPLHRRVDACIATSERAAEEARAFGIAKDRIHAIPNPLDTRRFRPAGAAERRARRAEFGLGDGFVAVNVGRVSPEKNQSMLLEAWTAFAAEHPTARLAVLGDGPRMDALRAQAEASPAADTILLLGNVDDPLPWYQAADLFVLSSDSEGLSNSLMEALACGLPVLSTRVSGAEDIDEEGRIARLVDVGDREAFARELTRLHDDPEWRTAQSPRARNWAETHYSIESVVTATERLYESLTSPKP